MKYGLNPIVSAESFVLCRNIGSILFTIKEMENIIDLFNKRLNGNLSSKDKYLYNLYRSVLKASKIV